MWFFYLGWKKQQKSCWRSLRIMRQDRLSSCSNIPGQWDLHRNAVGQLRLCNHLKTPKDTKIFQPSSMRLEKYTVGTTQLMCNKGGEDGVHELLPCTSIMRDWYKPQSLGTFPVLVPQLRRANLGAGIALFGHGQMPPWQSSEKFWVWDLLPLCRCWRRISCSWIYLGDFPKLCPARAALRHSSALGGPKPHPGVLG